LPENIRIFWILDFRISILDLKNDNSEIQN
jgi:hypothetical protein